MCKKREIVAFDFDGTLTTKDTLIEFIKFAKGRRCFYKGLLICSPMLVGYALRLVPNYKAKERLFAYFFRGTPYSDFCQYGVDFANVINRFVRQQALTCIKQHLLKGRKLYVISASVEEWVKPWCESHRISHVIATKIEVVNGVVTGRFLSKNCYGKEKVSRLLRAEPKRENYFLYAYGDSKGDRDLLAYADISYYKPFRE